MSGRIVTVSPNTSTDRIAIVDGFTVGGTCRTVDSFDQAGGSGAHAASVVIELGGEALAIVAIGGGNGERWRQAAARQHLPAEIVPLRRENRSSFVLIDRALGKVAEIVDPGPELTQDEAHHLLESVVRHLDGATVLVLSGSLPPGVPEDFYATCTARAREAGIPVVVDAHSGPMRAALAARPWLIKPNLDELHQIAGVASSTMAERIAIVRHLVETTVENVLLSMEAEGVLLGTPEGMWRLLPPPEPVTLPDSRGINPVGCGDALVGAFCQHWVESGDMVESARWGLAAAHVNLGKVEVPSSPLAEVRPMARQVRIEPVTVPVVS